MPTPSLIDRHALVDWSANSPIQVEEGWPGTVSPIAGSVSWNREPQRVELVVDGAMVSGEPGQLFVGVDVTPPMSGSCA